jgi:hypothetical protein
MSTKNLQNLKHAEALDKEQSNQIKSAPDLPDKSVVMAWTIRSAAGSPKDRFWSQLAFVAIGASVILYLAFIMRENLAKEYKPLLFISAGVSLYIGSYIYAIRQKTLYRYKIHPTRARLVYCLQYPKYARQFFKGFALAGIFLLILMSLMAGSLLFLAGVGAMAFMAAMRLLTWKNPIKREWSAPWDEYNFVTVDRKRRFVVTHITDTTLGFEARLPDDTLFEQYLAFLRSVLPPTAQFTEKKWDMSLI